MYIKMNTISNQGAIGEGFATEFGDGSVGSGCSCPGKIWGDAATEFGDGSISSGCSCSGKIWGDADCIGSGCCPGAFGGEWLCSWRTGLSLELRVSLPLLYCATVSLFSNLFYVFSSWSFQILSYVYL